jgi:H+-translocating NAD(P) transhydrogenase subunit alpha
LWFGMAALLGLVLIGSVAPREFLSHLTVFVLACFVGWQVIWNVSPALHTPLMSVTNAISGIIIVGGMLQVSGPPTATVTLLGAVAVLIATINIVGGFTVTQRMLRMFKR